jgi:hypothetical protein
MPDTIRGFVIFCDDVRQEADGKHTLVGCYHGNMFLPQFPANVTKFAFYVTIFEPMAEAEARTFGIPLRIFLPGDQPDKPTMIGEIPYQEGAITAIKAAMPAIDDPEPDASVRYGFVIIAAPLVIQRPGIIRVQVQSDNQFTDIGKMRVYQQPQSALPES